MWCAKFALNILNAIIHCFGESSNMFASLNGIVHMHTHSKDKSTYTNTNDETKTKNNSAHFSIFVRNFYLWYHLSTITTEKGYLYTNSRIIIWIIPPTRKKIYLRQMLKLFICLMHVLTNKNSGCCWYNVDEKLWNAIFVHIFAISFRVKWN